MKKYILLQLLFLLSILITNEAKSMNPTPKKKFIFALTSILKDCESGSGFCFVFIGYTNRTVEAEITILEKQIQFKLLRSTMSDDLEHELMQKNRFAIEAETILPMDITRELGYNTSIELIPGYYTYEIHDTSITITCAFE